MEFLKVTVASVLVCGGGLAGFFIALPLGVPEIGYLVGFGAGAAASAKLF